MTQVLVANDGTTQVYNLYGLDLISQDSGVEVRTLLVDGLGSVRLEMVGGVVETATTYSPYGEVVEQTGTNGTVYGFTGEQQDSATGFLYLRARYYNTSLKSFMSRDPWEGSGWQPATLNYYAYSHSNPINLTDPTGKTAWPKKNVVAIQALKPSIIDSATRHNNSTRSNLSDDAFAALMAAHLNRESRFGALTLRLPGDIVGDIAAQLLHADTSIGIANIRPSVGVEILFGIIPGVPSCYYYEIHGSEWLELWNTYPDSRYFYPYGASKAEAFQSLLVRELLDDELSIEYLAANIERGVDRAEFFNIEPSVFNLGNWLWRGVQHVETIKEELDRGNDVYRHGAAMVEDMPKAFEVLELPLTDYNAYNPDEAQFINR